MDSANSLWQEYFDDLANQTKFDQGKTAWSTDTSLAHNPIFEVKNGKFLAQNTDGVAVWKSEKIDISSAETVDFSLDVWSQGDLESSGKYADFVEVSYILDGGQEISLARRDGIIKNGPSEIGTKGLDGKTLQLIVRAQTTGSKESYLWDNIAVTAAASKQPDEPDNHDGGDSGHSDDLTGGHTDPAKMGEHASLLKLVPHSAATHVAVNDGSWFDAGTWKDGAIPDDDADVLIPKGTKVVYDGKSDASLHTIRVDGTLRFAHNADTKMVIDTFIVAPEGTLNIGTKSQPIQKNKTAQIIIADNGAIDLKWDPDQLSRGLVSHGQVTMHGAEKTVHLKLSKDALAGDKELFLSEAPQNWQVGDRIVLTGTHQIPRTASDPKKDLGTQDEELRIAQIDGNRIVLDRALQYDHDTPRSDLRASVANYTRNIVFETENYQDIPNNQRGHIMFMHSDDVDVRYAEFLELGRTDKHKALNDFRLEGARNSERVLDANGDPIPGERTNIRGRYAFHFHRTGVDSANDPAVAIGNAVWGSPGWGFVHHDSHAVMNNNAAYDVFGSAFVSETGNETGEWKNNIAINGQGLLRNIKFGGYNQDFGMQGNGFWFQSRTIENVGNIAAGMSGMGIAYFHRGIDNIDPLAENLANPEIARYTKQVEGEIPPLELFTDNEVFASGKALHIAKKEPNQGHDIRNMVTDFTGWEVEDGVHLEYTRHYTLEDLTLIASEASRQTDNIGVRFGNRTEDMAIADFQIDGFDKGISLVEGKDNGSFLFMDAKLTNNSNNLVSDTTKTSDFVSSDSYLRKGDLVFETDADKSFSAGSKLNIKGEKIDSLGRSEYMVGGDRILFEDDNISNRLEKGYYTLEDGTPILTVEIFVSDRLTGNFKEAAIPVRLNDVNVSEKTHLGVYDPSDNADGASQDLIIRQFVSRQDSIIVGTSSIDEFHIDPTNLSNYATVYAFEDDKDKLSLSSDKDYTLSDTQLKLGTTSVEATKVSFPNNEAVTVIGVTAEELLNDIMPAAST
ncbi:MAG: G8 domain-containing protein [Cyanophyceae cyanobacterium]